MATINATFNRYLAGILWRAKAWLKIELHPFIIEREGLQPLAPDLISLNPAYQFCKLTHADLDAIHGLRPDMSRSRYETFLQTGIECFGIKDDGKLIAKMWLNLEAFNSAIYSRPLLDDEAYLFDAFSNPAYRGQNLAPYLRLRCYQRAQQLGRTRIYSISDFTNTPARKFKQKLGAHGERLMLYIKLFNWPSRVVKLRNYPAPAANEKLL